MKLTFTLHLCFLSFSLLSQASLNSAISQFNEAFASGDVDQLEQMITPNYVHTNGQSKSFGADVWLSYLRKRSNQIDKGEIEVIDYQFTEQEIVQHGDMAVVTGKVSTSVRTNDEINTYHYRVSNIWVKTNSLWKRAAFHDTRIE